MGFTGIFSLEVLALLVDILSLLVLTFPVFIISRVQQAKTPKSRRNKSLIRNMALAHMYTSAHFNGFLYIVDLIAGH